MKDRRKRNYSEDGRFFFLASSISECRTDGDIVAVVCVCVCVHISVVEK